jgi:hypothetical protein
MNRRNVFWAIAIPIWMAASVAPAAPQPQVTPRTSIIVDKQIVTINSSAGNQTLPHISRDLWTVSTVVSLGFNEENPECSGGPCFQDP